MLKRIFIYILLLIFLKSLSGCAGLYSRPKVREPLPSKEGIGLYYVQVGSFREKKNAKNFSAYLTNRGYSTCVSLYQNRYFRVWIGPYATPEQAQKILSKLKKEEGLEPFLVKGDGDDLELKTQALPKKPPLEAKERVGKPLDEGKAQEIISTAQGFLGYPYRYGGSGPESFDCAGFVQSVFRQHKIYLPRTSYEQFEVGIKVRRRELQPADLVFFSTTGPGASHVGIYLGRDRFIHASLRVRRVVIAQLNQPYYETRFLGGRRVLL